MTAPTRISDEEKARRRESWHQANASVRIEGGTITPVFLALQERHIHGEITRAELREELDRMDRADAAASRATGG